MEGIEGTSNGWLGKGQSHTWTHTAISTNKDAVTVAGVAMTVPWKRNVKRDIAKREG